ncbi:MAG: WG repeat-containing protein [Proteobacteria bacterium]|jgi:hypothetical protein|nr:WG repeat-containing protein [Pseudomonadota bacterium]
MMTVHLAWLLLSTLLAGCPHRLSQPSPDAELVPFERRGQWGYRIEGGDVIIAPQYVAAMPFSPAGVAHVANENGWSLINREGAFLLEPLLVDNGPDPFENNLARYVEDGKVGFYFRDGEVVIPAQFEFAWPFRGNSANVCRSCELVPNGEHLRISGGEWAEVDSRGHLVTPWRSVEPNFPPLHQPDAGHTANTTFVLRFNEGWEMKHLELLGIRIEGQTVSLHRGEEARIDVPIPEGGGLVRLDVWQTFHLREGDTRYIYALPEMVTTVSGGGCAHYEMRPEEPVRGRESFAFDATKLSTHHFPLHLDVGLEPDFSMSQPATSKPVLANMNLGCGYSGTLLSARSASGQQLLKTFILIPGDALGTIVLRDDDWTLQVER